jgi:LPXTG-motif cell wall-anchored protein
MTRKLTLVLALCICILLVAIPGVALAQKDPFRPLVRPPSSSAPSTGSGGSVPATAPASSPSGAQLPQTGIDADLWSQLAALLILMGAGLLAADRFRRTAYRI